MVVKEVLKLVGALLLTYLESGGLYHCEVAEVVETPDKLVNRVILMLVDCLVQHLDLGGCLHICCVVGDCYLNLA